MTTPEKGLHITGEGRDRTEFTPLERAKIREFMDRMSEDFLTPDQLLELTDLQGISEIAGAIKAIAKHAKWIMLLLGTTGVTVSMFKSGTLAALLKLGGF